ncbi:hypothetical protein RhiirA5_376859 [Rhizophagus irregularis]|uniref:Uncharacterized protein n=1 Tax=Rhizophagus irregularis TaxID=588596 RepID=A0A2N0PLE4_9GLOM|nr:hypothetical protein RhiirA5_376859 [Rhizophagus irregularis]
MLQGVKRDCHPSLTSSNQSRLFKEKPEAVSSIISDKVQSLLVLGDIPFQTILSSGTHKEENRTDFLSYYRCILAGLSLSRYGILASIFLSLFELRIYVNWYFFYINSCLNINKRGFI